MRILTTKEAVNNAIRVLLNSAKVVETTMWQGVPHDSKIIDPRVKHKMVEVCNAFLVMRMETLEPSVYSDTGADWPWAGQHFRERLDGPSNPGETYKYWPYATDYTDYLNGEGKFSHTYQERFWPLRSTGYRYEAGNWEDVKQRLSSDPTTRQCFLTIWHPEDQSNNDVRVPCTIGYWFKINGDRLDLTYLIRSCDALRHFRNDVYMAQMLAMEMVCHLNINGFPELRLGNLSMWIGSFHCFESDKYELKKRLR